MMKFLPLFVFILVTASSFAQLPKKMNRFIGSWEYKEHSGHDHWSIRDGNLIGESHRIDKGGDTLAVELMMIENNNEYLVYRSVLPSLSDEMSSEITFKSKNTKKLLFVNASTEMPYSIAYSFGFFNRNKMKIKINLGANKGSVKLVLYRVIE